MCADVLTADVLTADALTADALTAGVLTADALTADALTADALTADALTAGVLTAGVLTADALTADVLYTDVVLPVLLGSAKLGMLVPLPASCSCIFRCLRSRFSLLRALLLGAALASNKQSSYESNVLEPSLEPGRFGVSNLG